MCVNTTAESSKLVLAQAPAIYSEIKESNYFKSEPKIDETEEEKNILSNIYSSVGSSSDTNEESVTSTPIESSEDISISEENSSFIEENSSTVEENSSYISEGVEEETEDNPNEQVESELSYIGEFKITWYCGGYCCNGKWAGKTASGATPSEGVTIAVDPKVIPLGTKVYIEGIGWRIAQDTGGAIKGNKIDVFVSDHNNIPSIGVTYCNVYR